MIIETKHILKNMQNSHEIDGNIAKIKRLDCNMESKSSNNTYLNIIKIFNKLFKKNKHH